MATYTIERFNGSPARTAESMKSAIAAAKAMLGVDRVYRGAQYQTDRPAQDGDRELCTALDLWKSRANARQEMNVPADVVISWGER